MQFNSKRTHFSFDKERRGFNIKCLYPCSGATLCTVFSSVVSTVFSSADFYHAILLRSACKGGVGSVPTRLRLFLT
jgi:hypothetical protein